ncbi:MAG: M15 family metallopeptidase [Gemmatimonadales bacterium]
MELLPEALAATPPSGATARESDLVEISALDPSIKLDIRYATDDNFMGTRFYSEARAFAQRDVAAALVRVNARVRELGFGLLIHDAYRPWYVTKMFWEATPDSQKAFVADPTSGSRHNRGAAIDLSLYHLVSGDPVEMPSAYDEFSDRASADYEGGTPRSRELRDLLRHAMESEGFSVYAEEWWHFDHETWRDYPVTNLTFDQISGGR